ncbi:hypothetical protein STEG23_037633, partial [Scotinomys teguina]
YLYLTKDRHDVYLNGKRGGEHLGRVGKSYQRKRCPSALHTPHDMLLHNKPKGCGTDNLLKIPKPLEKKFDKDIPCRAECSRVPNSAQCPVLGLHVNYYLPPEESSPMMAG